MPDVADVRIYLAGAAAILDEYPKEVGDMLADPRSGTRLIKPFPSLHDLRDACDLAYEPIGREVERQRATASHYVGLAAPAKPDEARRAEQVEDYEKRVKPTLVAALKPMPKVPEFYQRPDDGKHAERVRLDIEQRRIRKDPDSPSQTTQE